MAALIKKEDVSTDNIYEYEYADGAFSGYWLKFKYVSVPMDTRDPFNPVQNDNAYAVYDAYIFESELSDVTNLIGGMLEHVDFFYVEESVYQAIAANDPKFLDEYSLIPYQITDNIITVNKYYLPADFDINDYEQDPDEPVEVVYVTPDRSYNMKIGDKFSGILYGISITGNVSGDNLPDEGTPLGIFYAKDFTNDVIYCEMSASTSGNQAIDLSLRNEWIGHYPIDAIADWRENNTLEMYLRKTTDETDFPGKVRIYPNLLINGNQQTNYINGISTEENPVKDYIEFDVSGGTEELENWIVSFQNNVYLYQMEKPDTDYIISGLEWSISDLIIHYTDGTGISDLGELQQLSLTATDNKTFSDGTNTYSLQPMEDLLRGR